MEIFYVIVMKLRNGHKMYLGCGEREGLNMIWTNKDEACWFNTDKEAKDFAENYFINFKDYSIEELGCNLEEVR